MKFDIKEIKMDIDIESKASPDDMLERIRWATKYMPNKSLIILDKVDAIADSRYTLRLTIDIVGNVDLDDMYNTIAWAIRGMPGIKNIYREMSDKNGQ